MTDVWELTDCSCRTGIRFECGELKSMNKHGNCPRCCAFLGSIKIYRISKFAIFATVAVQLRCGQSTINAPARKWSFHMISVSFALTSSLNAKGRSSTVTTQEGTNGKERTRLAASSHQLSRLLLHYRRHKRDICDVFGILIKFINKQLFWRVG